MKDCKLLFIGEVVMNKAILRLPNSLKSMRFFCLVTASTLSEKILSIALFTMEKMQDAVRGDKSLTVRHIWAAWLPGCQNSDLSNCESKLVFTRFSLTLILSERCISITSAKHGFFLADAAFSRTRPISAANTLVALSFQ